MSIIEDPTAEFEQQFVLAINARRKLKGVCINKTLYFQFLIKI